MSRHFYKIALLYVLFLASQISYSMQPPSGVYLSPKSARKQTRKRKQTVEEILSIMNNCYRTLTQRLSTVDNVTAPNQVAVAQQQINSLVLVQHALFTDLVWQNHFNLFAHRTNSRKSKHLMPILISKCTDFEKLQLIRNNLLDMSQHLTEPEK